MEEDEAHALGDAPTEEAYRGKMLAIAETLDRFFNGDDEGPNRKVGFILLTFLYETGDLTEEQRFCNYISNGADRRDVVALMREQIRRFEELSETDVTK